MYVDLVENEIIALLFEYVLSDADVDIMTPARWATFLHNTRHYDALQGKMKRCAFLMRVIIAGFFHTKFDGKH